MTDLGYITIGSREFVRADTWTQEQQELRDTGVVPWMDTDGKWHSKRIVTSYPAERAAFWEQIEQRAKDRRPVLRRVV